MHTTKRKCSGHISLKNKQINKKLYIFYIKSALRMKKTKQNKRTTNAMMYNSVLLIYCIPIIYLFITGQCAVTLKRWLHQICSPTQIQSHEKIKLHYKNN